MKKKLIAILMCLVLCIALMQLLTFAQPTEPSGVWTDFAAADFEGGNGTETDPYRISTAEQLAKLASDINSGVYNRSHSNEYFVLTNNIDLSAHRWVPIGSGTTVNSHHSFCAYFDGRTFTISNMYVDESNDEFAAGLFGNVSGRVIKNLNVTNAYVKTKQKSNEYNIIDGAGILIGNAAQGYGVTISVINCKVSGEVVTDTASPVACGGLVGSNSYGVYENCETEVTINGRGYSGGFIGTDFMGSYKNCVSKGKVNGYYSVGGFAGSLYCESKADKCISYATVKGSNWHIGGFVGYVGSDPSYGPSEINNCVAYGDVTSTLKYDPTRVGGFVGTNDGTKIEKSHAAGKVTSDAEGGPAGGFCGYDNNGTTVGCSYDAEHNAEIKPVGSASDPQNSNNDIQAGTKNEVLANICNDYYGSHNWNTDSYVTDIEATCTQPGSKSYHCSRCDSAGTAVEIAPNGHSYGTLVAKVEATCENKGYEAHYQCSICKALFDANKVEKTHEELVIAKKGHSYSDQFTVDVQPTCTEKGSESRHCTRCDDRTDVTAIAALGHMGGEATCTKKAVCTVCKSEYGSVNVAVHKNLKKVRNGNNEYWHCEDCNDNFSDESGKNRIEISGIIPADSGKNTNSDLPKTGDDSNLTLWFALLFVSSGIIVAAYGRRKRSLRRG